MGVGVGGRGVGGAGGAGEGVDRGDDRRGGAGAAVDGPAAAAVGLVDGDAGLRVGHRGDVGVGALAAAGGDVLERRLGHRDRAAAAGAAPGGFGPAAGAAALGQRGAADRGDVLRGGRVADAVAGVAGAGGDRDARVVEVAGVVAGFAAVLTAAVAVGHVLGAQRHGGVHRGAEVGGARLAGFDEQDVAVGADGGDHVDVEGDLAGPAAVRSGQGAGLAVFVDLLEAAVGGGAGRQAVGGAVGGEVGFGVGVVVGVHNGHCRGRAAARGQVVGAAQTGRAEAAGQGVGREQGAHGVGLAFRETRCHTWFCDRGADACGRVDGGGRRGRGDGRCRYRGCGQCQRRESGDGEDSSG